METKADRGQILLELSIFVLILVAIVGLTFKQTQKLKNDFKKIQIGKFYEKNKIR